MCMLGRDLLWPIDLWECSKTNLEKIEMAQRRINRAILFI